MFNDLDLQWFAEDDDDESFDVASLFDDDETNDSAEVLGEETYDTDTKSEFTTSDDGKEINLDTGEDGHSDGSIESAWWNDSDDAQDLKEELGHDYSRASTETRNADGSVNKDWMHNAYAAGNRATDAVKGWVSDKARAVDMAFGGNRNGFTSADLERNKEARNAYAIYDEKAKTAEKALTNFGNKYDPNNKDDVAKYNELKAEYEDYTNRRDAINRDIQSTDTGSRLGNVAGNIKEDLGDAGTRINQFLGGADEYGLGSKGQINDRNGDGKVSISERLQNMGRDAATWAGNQLKNYGTGALGTLASFGNPLVGIAVSKAANKGIDALIDYARSHPNNLTSAEKAELAKAEAENNSTNDSSESDEPNVPAKTISIDNAPKVARNNWTEMKINALGNNGQNFGGWNKVNDTMGQKTMALSDAHFKDFVLAMMVDEPGMQNVIKTKLMLDYFK